MSIDGHTRVFDTVAEIRRLKERVAALEAHLADRAPPPPEPDPIEVMARAMWDALGSGAWADAHPRAKSDYRVMACAALAALEPDKEMIDAGARALCDAPRTMPFGEKAGYVFRTMINTKIKTRT